ncbi:hypothetical protein ACFLS4_01385 [Bacteroidota bacterium]
MKRKLLIFLTIVFIPGILISQETEQKAKVTLSGYVRYELFMDTYESVDTRDGEVYLYPLSENLDINDDDINKNLSLNMLGLQARPKIIATGLSAFGAEVTGVLEGDFLGVSQADSRMLRLRHGFLNLKWQKSQLLMGHYWHPMFVTECFPATVSMGAGVPFHVLNRAPQVRYTANLGSKFSLMGALLVHGYHKSVGPANAQRNSGLPDMQLQFKFKNDYVFSSITAGYKFLKPRLVTDTLGVKTDEMIGSFNLAANAKFSFKPLTIKVEGIYGQNLTNFVMIGGYGASDDPYTVDDYGYSNINTMSVWADFALNFDNIEVALFGGYSSNLSATDDYYSLTVKEIDQSYTRGETIKSIFRVSPRLIIKSGKVDFGLEYMLTGAVYGTLDTVNPDYSFEDTDKPTINNRVIFSARYSF